MKEKSPGQIGYEAYANHSHWKSLATGADLPPWNDLHERIRLAWEVSADAILRDRWD